MEISDQIYVALITSLYHKSMNEKTYFGEKGKEARVRRPTGVTAGKRESPETASRPYKNIKIKTQTPSRYTILQHTTLFTWRDFTFRKEFLLF